MKNGLKEAGCRQCANFGGKGAAAVSNFRCRKGETVLHVCYCKSFEKKALEPGGK